MVGAEPGVVGGEAGVGGGEAVFLDFFVSDGLLGFLRAKRFLDFFTTLLVLLVDGVLFFDVVVSMVVANRFISKHSFLFILAPHHLHNNLH